MSGAGPFPRQRSLRARGKALSGHGALTGRIGWRAGGLGAAGKGGAAPCIFCSIARHEAPSRIVYEDENTIAFLDIAPLSRGHTLVVPKAHVDRLTDLPPDQYAPLLSTLARVCRRVERLSTHYNVGLNQGALAGQIVFHLHFHVIPRYEGQRTFPRVRKEITEEDGRSVHGLLRAD